MCEKPLPPANRACCMPPPARAKLMLSGLALYWLLGILRNQAGRELLLKIEQTSLRQKFPPR